MHLSRRIDEDWYDDPDVLARLFAAMMSAETEALDSPYVVVRRDRSTGRTLFNGPYESAIAALAAADRDERIESGRDGADLGFGVVRLCPPL
ncbi:hypothetical protein G5V59_15640 [Nocardioides sp. W3-2-3]|uniref:hypothetical protein n=1 Tax=Nocardioides convexus TaxID=2712224 RepID=UPI0024188259|nr:hypothetical protein [Nocardioides convexus]NHA00866.1 hypothetical protein [Nocardioides convexus]